MSSLRSLRDPMRLCRGHLYAYVLTIPAGGEDRIDVGAIGSFPAIISHLRSPPSWRGGLTRTAGFQPGGNGFSLALLVDANGNSPKVAYRTRRTTS